MNLYSGILSVCLIVLLPATATFAKDKEDKEDKCIVKFDNSELNLGDLTSTTTFGITYSKCKNKSISIESDNTLELSSNSSITIGYNVALNGNPLITNNHKDQTITATITPEAFPAIQRAGNYIDDITVTISAL